MSVMLTYFEKDTLAEFLMPDFTLRSLMSSDESITFESFIYSYH